MFQKEWNSTARMAGRKAYAKARKEGASTERATSAYKRAYDKVWRQSPAGKLWKKRWRRSPAGREANRKWQSSWNKTVVGRKKRQRIDSRRYLRRAIQMKGPLLNGWPDARLLEQKIGGDFVRSDQWRRAAQACAMGIVFSLLFAATHEDAAYTKKYKIISFKEYAKQLGMIREWTELVRKVKNLSRKTL
jgi:hypothetical protein